MEATVNISMNLTLKNRTDALEMVNKSLNDDYEDLGLLGVFPESLIECGDLVVNEIITSEDGIEIELYKSQATNKSIIKTSRKEIQFGNIIEANGEFLVVINCGDGVNLYSIDKQMFHFQNNLQSIQEIMIYLEGNSVDFEVHILR